MSHDSGGRPRNKAKEQPYIRLARIISSRDMGVLRISGRRLKNSEIRDGTTGGFYTGHNSMMDLPKPSRQTNTVNQHFNSVLGFIMWQGILILYLSFLSRTSIESVPFRSGSKPTVRVSTEKNCPFPK